jgi:hypothetical protein
MFSEWEEDELRFLHDNVKVEVSTRLLLGKG